MRCQPGVHIGRSMQTCLLLLCWACLSVSVPFPCKTKEDTGKTPVGLSASIKTKAGEVSGQILCGEDAAIAAARVALHRKNNLQEGKEVLKLAKEFQSALDREAERGDIGYLAPQVLDAGTPQERPRMLKTGGQFSRRANDHAKQGEFREAVADLLRALMRPNVDETAYDRLMSTMENFLAKASKEQSKKAADGDLGELFEVLGLEDDGKDNADIDRGMLKRKYRELSVKYHPDKNPEADASRFNRIRDAYEVLSDPVKTLLYDTGGMELVKKYEGGSDNLERTDGQEFDIQVELKDVYKGVVREVTAKRRVVCRSCRLQPNLPRCRACNACPGVQKQRQVWIDQMRYYVEEYEEKSDEKCTTDRTQIPVAIEKGMMAGDTVRHSGMASQRPKKIPGDITVNIKVRQHSIFKRVGNDLLVDASISLHEALLGFSLEILHLDAHVVTVNVERGQVVKPGSAVEIQGEGMPLREDPSIYGKLIVRFTVDFPKTLSPQQTTLLEKALNDAGLGPSSKPQTKSRPNSEL